MSTKAVIIGLAGGIGSGKSLVARTMGDLGAIILDADEAAHEILSEPDVIACLSDWWGPSVLTSDGRVDRRRVAEMVFGDGEKRRRLEALIHPRIFAKWAETLERVRRDASIAPAVVIDAPLLFECGLDGECDTIVFVDVPEDVRAERVLRNRGWSSQEFRQRENNQKSLDIKREKADHIVENNSGVSDLRQRVESLFSTIISRDP